MKSKLKLITILRVEGAYSDPWKPGETRCFTTFESARLDLQKVCNEERGDGTYDKMDFSVEWENGEVYSGRYDACGRHNSSHENPHLGARIETHLCFMAGHESNRPGWMSNSDWAEHCARISEGAKVDIASFFERNALED